MQIVVDGNQAETWLRSLADGRSWFEQLTLEQARAALDAGERVGVYVEGWARPWICEIDAKGQVRARCPSPGGGSALVTEKKPNEKRAR